MAKGKSIPLTSRLARWRVWVQATFLVAWLDPLMIRMHTVCSPVFHCYSCPLALFACPIGVMANFSALHIFPFLAVGTLVIIGALFGSFICGWVCPFGFLQDLIGRIPTRKFELPGWMGYTRYVVLVVCVLAIPYGIPDWLLLRSTDVTVESPTSDVTSRLGIGSGGKGVIVTGVETDSPAYRLGIRPQDVVVSVNDRGIQDVADFLDATRGRDGFDMQVERDGERRSVSVQSVGSARAKLERLNEDWLGYGSPLFICSICPAGALEAAVPNVVSSATSDTLRFNVQLPAMPPEPNDIDGGELVVAIDGEPQEPMATEKGQTVVEGFAGAPGTEVELSFVYLDSAGNALDMPSVINQELVDTISPPDDGKLGIALGGKIAWPSTTKTVILVVFLVAMFFTWRPWCTLFCPLGAIYGILNWVSFFFVKFHPHECNDCDRCRTLCKYHGRGERRGDDMRCIRCLDCTRCTAVTFSTIFKRQPKSADEPQLVNIEPADKNE